MKAVKECNCILFHSYISLSGFKSTIEELAFLNGYAIVEELIMEFGGGGGEAPEFNLN